MTREILLSTLQSLDYTTLELLLTPLQFGIPNSRLRYYLLAKRKPQTFAGVNVVHRQVWRWIPGQLEGWTDPRERTEPAADDDADTAVNEIRQYMDDDLGDEHPFIIPDRVLQKWGRLFDIVLPSSKRTCCFTRGYSQLVERSGSIIQTNEELNTTAIFDEFLASQATGDANAVELLRPLKLRYFTPSELLRIFDFEKSTTNSHGKEERPFQWPDTVTIKNKYRLIGNSVNTRVVMELLNYLFQ
ncbi:hypothetical protein AX17_000012 [Amanita inopinata Kibby_2008]|nr:hypothetical protein AX17_000012 [Amanita inopinata Kibby_2008]